MGTKKALNFHSRLTGDERIELPLKVLETLVIPFDQSPLQHCLAILHQGSVLCQVLFDIILFFLKNHYITTIFLLQQSCQLSDITHFN